MANLNKVMLIGNLTRDPELKNTIKGTAVCDIGLAINSVSKNASGDKVEQTTFVDITFFGSVAELVDKYVQKGNPLFVEGRLQLDSWDDKQTGQRRTKLKVIGENIQFLNGKRDDNSAPRQSRASQPTLTQNEEDEVVF